MHQIKQTRREKCPCPSCHHQSQNVCISTRMKITNFVNEAMPREKKKGNDK